MYLLIIVLLALSTAGIIVLLHRDQRRKRAEIVERTAPLAAVDLAFDAPAAEAVTNSNDNWQEQVRQLREQGKEQAALALCRLQFPRIQAFQQAALILRHLVRNRLEANQDAGSELRELYRSAVMADLYRSGNPVKPRDPRHALQQLLQREFDYQSIGTGELRLLTKSDVRHLEQLWGRPAQHRHAEYCKALDWPTLCKATAGSKP